MGYDAVSVAPNSFPEIKYAVRNTPCTEARALADEALQQTTTADVLRVRQGSAADCADLRASFSTRFSVRVTVAREAGFGPRGWHASLDSAPSQPTFAGRCTRGGRGVDWERTTRARARVRARGPGPGYNGPRPNGRAHSHPNAALRAAAAPRHQPRKAAGRRPRSRGSRTCTGCATRRASRAPCSARRPACGAWPRRSSARAPGAGPWSAQETKQLKRYLGASNAEVIARVLGRDRATRSSPDHSSSAAAASPTSRWTRDETLRFKRIYGTRSDEDLGADLRPARSRRSDGTHRALPPGQGQGFPAPAQRQRRDAHAALGRGRVDAT